MEDKLQSSIKQPSLLLYILESIKNFPPSYFAALMATGIVSIAFHLLNFHTISIYLSITNLLFAPFFIIVFSLRVIIYPRHILSDACNHNLAHGYFTIVAAAGVIGVQLHLIHEQQQLAQSIWFVAFVLWIVINYLIFTGLTIKQEKPTIEKGINGGWLIAVVATQSICVLGCIIGADFLIDRSITLFALLSFWLFGGMLYLWIIGLIFYRYMFYSFSPKEAMPPYWINMGAVAISALAGTLLAGQITNSQFHFIFPFIIGFTLFYWSTATWWIPMLFILGFWRHFIHRVPLAYDPLYWGLVFPFGMYSVSTYRLIEFLKLD